ncbi:MAG: hypothetical protein HYR55_04275 [Acidobacteria bacterium]|nr:hypothetical protein [Acidobacteriota bacterium]MBI3658675.1 hypothetical protein [Acidobacteriota bacterium]
MKERIKRLLGFGLIMWISLLGIQGRANPVAAPMTFYGSMTYGASQLMPAHFKKILDQRRDHLVAAANQFVTAQPTAGSIALVERIEARVQIIQQGLSQNVSFDNLVSEFGLLARLMADLEDPTPHAEAVSTATQLHHEFFALLEKKKAKLPTVFYGYDAALFQKRDLRLFLMGIAERSRLAGERLAGTYVNRGKVRAFADADDRSPAFGIAALYYSHTISDVANVWLYLWWQSFGDMRGTPFFDVAAKP